MKESKRTKAPNICRMTDWSNHVIKWLISEIVSIRDLKSRAARMDNIIQMCKYLEELNNFNGMKEVVAALESSAIHRLRKTRDALAPASLKMLENFQAQTSSELNFKLLRAKIRETAPPYIPFPGVVQSDIVFLDSCGKNITANGMINFQKFVKTTGFVQELLVSENFNFFVVYLKMKSNETNYCSRARKKPSTLLKRTRMCKTMFVTLRRWTMIGLMKRRLFANQGRIRISFNYLFVFSIYFFS